MENASKALLMAGGILIAILIIALLVRSFTSVSIFQKAKLTEEEQEQLLAFNEQYTKYMNQYVYGTEVITIINKTVNYNAKNSDNINVEIKFTVEDYEYKRVTYKDGKKIEKKLVIKNGGTLSLKNEEDKFNFINSDNTENVEQLTHRAFKCDSIKYDNSTGKVNYIHFTEVKYNG